MSDVTRISAKLSIDKVNSDKWFKLCEGIHVQRLEDGIAFCVEFAAQGITCKEDIKFEWDEFTYTRAVSLIDTRTHTVFSISRGMCREFSTAKDTVYMKRTLDGTSEIHAYHEVQPLPHDDFIALINQSVSVQNDN